MKNLVILIGHLGQDPEIRRLENGTPVGRFSLATSESYKDSAGEWQTQGEWHNLVVWRQNAELAEKLLKKGALVYVEGKISYRKYTDKNGVERTSTDITVNSFRILGKKESAVTSEAKQESSKEAVYEPASVDNSVLNSDKSDDFSDLPF